MAKILIVEDELLSLYLLQHHFSKGKHDVTEIMASGENAVDAVESLKPDIIIMDIFLKGEINGIQTMERIRERTGTPVIFISGTEDLTLIQKAKAIKNACFLRKPFFSPELENCIMEITGQEPVIE